MSNATKIAEGGTVPVELQIENGDATKFPRAVIRNAADAIIATRDLTHLADGLYKPTSIFPMPVTSFIAVQYLVFDDSGRTVLSTDVGFDTDVFVLDSDGAAVTEEPSCVIQVVVSKFVIKAKAIQQKIKAVVKEQPAIIVKVVSPLIKIAVKQQSISVKIICE